MSGSPQGVFGCTQPFGVSMKWLASLAGPRIESLIDPLGAVWPYVVVTKIAAATAPSSTLRIAGIIRCIVTPQGTPSRRSGRPKERRQGVPADPRNVVKAFRQTQGTSSRRSGRPKERRQGVPADPRNV